MKIVNKLFKLPLARLMIKILPKKPEPKVVTQLPEETVIQYNERVPLIERPTAEPIKLNYRGQPIK